MGSIFSASKYLKWANYEGSAPLSQKETKFSCFTMGRNIWNKTHRINYLYIFCIYFVYLFIFSYYNVVMIKITFFNDSTPSCFFASQVTGVKRSKITTYAHVTMQGILNKIPTGNTCFHYREPFSHCRDPVFITGIPLQGIAV